MIDWNFMYDALHVFGFHQYFNNWVKLLYIYIYIQGRVINNGWNPPEAHGLGHYITVR